jgi:hypothetical protein
MPAGYVETVSTTPESNREGMVVRQVGEVSAIAAAEGVANPTAFQRLSHGLLWNSATWDRAMGNVDATAIAQGVRTAVTVESADLINYNHRGVHVALNYSTGTANLVLRIQGKDAFGGAYYNIATGVSISASSTAIFKLYPGISAGAAGITGMSVNDVLPRTWRVTVVGSGTSATANYGVGYSMIK